VTPPVAAYYMAVAARPARPRHLIGYFAFRGGGDTVSIPVDHPPPTPPHAFPSPADPQAPIPGGKYRHSFRAMFLDRLGPNCGLKTGQLFQRKVPRFQREY
jgi:hypothetical protein